MKRLIPVGLALIIAGCAGSKSLSVPVITEPTPEPSTFPAPPTSVHTAPTSTTTEAPARGEALTGLGATSGGWNANHQMDPKATPGFAYLPLIPMPGGGSDQYASVDQSQGRVVGFTFALLQKTSLAGAERWVMQQLPPDAILVTKFMTKTADRKGSCELLNYRSATLATVLGPAPFGDTDGDTGAVLFTTTADDARVFDLNNINTGSLGLVPAQRDGIC